MSEITRRIYGTEYEWATTIEHLDDIGSFPPLILDFQTFPMARYVRESSQLHSVDTMLSNGGRLYVDQGFLEYATPEESTIEGAVLREIAGERIVLRVLAAYLRERRDSIRQASVRKRVIEDGGRTWGYHANLLADREALGDMNIRNLHLLALHLATSQPLIGAGAIQWTSRRGMYYSFGQKVLDLNIDAERATLGQRKPLINTRDESLADSDKYRRVHITSLDPHISPWATELTLGSCSLVLRAIEQGIAHDICVPTPTTDTLVNLAKANARDLRLSNKIQLVNGDTTTAVEIQQMIMDVVSRTVHTDEEARILDEWRRAVADLKQNIFLLRNRSDAIARLSLIRSLALKNHADPDDMSTKYARSVDGYYDQIFELGTKRFPYDIADPLDSYFASYAQNRRTKDMKDRMPSERAIQDAMYNPPSTTRAYGRARAIASGRAKGADWVKYLDNGKIIFTSDPHNPDIQAYA